MSDVEAASQCPRCEFPRPERGRFCGRCGTDVGAEGGDGTHRRGAYAAHPGETVLSLGLVTSLMPRAAGPAAQAFRWVLTAAVAIPLLAALFGFLAVAMVAAALAVPVVYGVYLYAVNEWEDQPVPVVLAAVALAGALAAGFTLLWSTGLLGGGLSLRVGSGGFSIDWSTLLVVGLVVPMGVVALSQIGPLWLASKPRFDDLIDGLTFGVLSGAAFAAVETLVLNRALILDGPGRVESPDAGAWISIVVVAALLKPLAYGTAVGLVGAAWSGRGPGYDGFSSAYWRSVAVAITALVAFQTGLYVTGRFGGNLGLIAGALVGTVVVAALLLRLRVVLHTALLEGALASAAGGMTSQGVGVCAECELPLLPGSAFCVACGSSIRAASKVAQRANTAEDQAGARPGTASRQEAPVLVAAAIAVIALAAALFGVVSTLTDPPGSDLREEAGGKPLARPRWPKSADQTGKPVAPPLASASTNDYAQGTVAADVITLDGGIEVPVPPGWDVVSSDATTADMATDGGLARVTTAQIDGEQQTVDGLLGDFVEQVLSTELQAVSGTSTQFEPPSGLLGDGSFVFTALLATQDGGTIPVEGDLEVLIAPDTTAFVDYLFPPGGFEALASDYNLIYSGVVASLIGGSGDTPVDPADPGTAGEPVPPSDFIPEYGTDPAFDELADACFDGELAACDELYEVSPVSELTNSYEGYAATCGGRLPESLYTCVSQL